MRATPPFDIDASFARRPLPIRFTASKETLTALFADCAVLPVLPNTTLTPSGIALDTQYQGKVMAAIRSGDLPEKPGATLLLQMGGASIARVLLVSLCQTPDDDDLTAQIATKHSVSEQCFSDALAGAWSALQAIPAANVVSFLHETPVTERPTSWSCDRQVLAFSEGAYSPSILKSKKTPYKGPSQLSLWVEEREFESVSARLHHTTCIAEGIQQARSLGDLPPNICTPTYLASVAKEATKALPVEVEVLEAEQLKALGMGAFLAVASGSEQPPKLIVMKYSGNANKSAGTGPVVLVGKGITFDSGGISIKPAADMDEMKYDMSGAGAVLSTLWTVAKMQWPINLIGIVAASENLPSGCATKPGDIVRTMSGQTVEILNTDAEGRLVLCDALTYAKRFQPSIVIDVATLTGACVIALGHHHAGLFSTDETLAKALVSAGRVSGDTCWHMPLDKAYQTQLKSPFADMANIGGRAAGSVTAACFLARFANSYRWAHLDVAGVAWKSGKTDKGSTGRPVGLLCEFLHQHCFGTQHIARQGSGRQ